MIWKRDINSRLSLRPGWSRGHIPKTGYGRPQAGRADISGDLVTVQVGAFDLPSRLGGLSSSGRLTRGFVFFCNRSACTYFSAIIKAPDEVSLQGDSAEWIIECPKQENGEPTMSYLGPLFFYNSWAIANKKNKIRRVMKKDLNGAILIDIVQNGVTLSRMERENNSVLGIFGKQRTNSTRVGQLE